MNPMTRSYLRNSPKTWLAFAAALTVAGQMAAQAQAVSNRLFSETFEGITLGPNVEEGLAGTEVWSGTPPAGWILDNSLMPGFGNPATDGVREWAGWAFANKDWWVAAAGNQRRAEFVFGGGNVMIADPDEWDDANHAQGHMNTFITLPPINVTGAAANSLILAFDSSWRPEAFDDGLDSFPVDDEGRPTNHQNGVVDAWFDSGTTNRVVNFDSDPDSPNFHADGVYINESVVVPLNNPAGATSLKLRFAMLTAANDWWWAVDNVAVGLPPLLTTVVGNGVAVTNLIAEALGKTVNDAAGVTLTINGTTVTGAEVARRAVNDEVPEVERVFVTYTGTSVFPPRSRVNVALQYTDNTGRVIRDTGEFIAPGYMTLSGSPRSLTATLTDAEWLTINEAAGVQIEVNGTAVTPASVTRVENRVVVVYTPATIFPSGSRQTVRATYRSATGQVLNETVGITMPTYATVPASLGTAIGTGADPGMIWRTHQIATNRSTSLALAEQQLQGLLGPTIHDTSLEVGGRFLIDFVNFDELGGEAGNFKASGEGELGVSDGTIPGIPGIGEVINTDNVTGEARTFVQFPAAGLYNMVVNSDDGFRLSVGTTNNPVEQILGQYDGGRGSADSSIFFQITQPGVYFFRLLWMEGGGGSNVEWFTVNPNGSRALVNGTQTGSLVSYRRRTVAEPSTGPTISTTVPGIPGTAPLSNVQIDTATKTITATLPEGAGASSSFFSISPSVTITSFGYNPTTRVLTIIYQ